MASASSLNLKGSVSGQVHRAARAAGGEIERPHPVAPGKIMQLQFQSSVPSAPKGQSQQERQEGVPWCLLFDR
ncbi:MAG TPA: hypothetical protein VH374_17070 [Polyangia bacterium]|jgi:hypothetical protein|nr:hypothetical protein [Polyangia bacterium]